MTTALVGPELEEVADRIRRAVPQAQVEVCPEWLVVDADHLVPVCLFLRDDGGLDMKCLVAVTGVDRLDHFEVVYHLQSFRHNHLLVLKTRSFDHDAPELPSVTPVWIGATLQEREVYDLMGIRFAGHRDLRRIFLWDGFRGHPLRKDFLRMPGGFNPGLPKFPKE